MSALSSRAVFLSYASQDAAAARRLAEALRAAGVEVWFDQNELVGGDAWDQKIRRQIRKCALFVPILSRTTQSRREAYFRLEWRLAEERTHLMAKGTPFLLPVALDETSDRNALVPDSFLAVQWTRLPAGETPTGFVTHVKSLLEGLDVPAGLEPAREAAEERTPDATRPVRSDRTVVRTRPWLVPVLVGAVALAVLLAWRPWAGPVVPTAGAVPASTKAQQLLARARALFQPWALATVEDFRMAEQLLKEAAELETANAEIAVAAAIVDYGFVVLDDDSSDARYEQLRRQSQRASRLAPDADGSKLALALSYLSRPATEADGIGLLRQLEKKNPRDAFVLLCLGTALGSTEQEEARELLRRSAALSPGDPNALFAEVWVVRVKNQFAEMIRLLDAALALRPDFPRARIAKLQVLRNFLGDLERAKAELEKIPRSMLADEEGAAAAVFVWYWGRNPDKCLEALSLTGRDYLRTTVGPQPKALIAGQAQRLAGRLSAAEAEWRKALRLTEQRIAQGDDVLDYRNRAYLLAVLGDKANAEAELRRYEQLSKQPEGELNVFSVHTYAALGRTDAVIDFFATRLKRPQGLDEWAGDAINDPEFDTVRSLPRFQTVLVAAQAVLAKNRGGPVSSETRP